MSEEDQLKRAFFGRGAEHDVNPARPKAKALIPVGEKLYHECRGMMGTENHGQDVALLAVIRHVIASTKP